MTGDVILTPEEVTGICEALNLHRDPKTGKWLCSIADYVTSGPTPVQAVIQAIKIVDMTIWTEKGYGEIVRQACLKLPLARESMEHHFKDVSITAAITKGEEMRAEYYRRAESPEFKEFVKKFWEGIPEEKKQ